MGVVAWAYANQGLSLSRDPGHATGVRNALVGSEVNPRLSRTNAPRVLCEAAGLVDGFGSSRRSS